MEQLPVNPQEAAYWLTLAFQLKGTKPKERNGLVLTADRRHELGLLELAQMDTDALPAGLSAYATVHRALVNADGRVSAQAFLVEALREAGARLLPITRPEYPRHLALGLGPASAPPVLSVAGDASLLVSPGVAISGSRKAGSEGLEFAAALGKALAERGVTVVTGLARGVDMEATNAALAAGGNVVGVSAAGILKTSARTRPEVAQGRLTVVSEFAPRARWQGWMAMARNRTIAGLSRALVIADCIAEGGTTAQFGVHRALGFPVFVRRGSGEGRLMAELSRRPGAYPVHWSGGPAGSQADQVLGGPRDGVRVTQEAVGEGQRLIVDFGPDADPRTVLQAVRDTLGLQSPPTLVAEPNAAQYRATIESPETQSADEPGADPVIDALREAGASGVSLKDLSNALGWGRKKVDSRLKSLMEVGTVSREKQGRSFFYRLRRERPPSEVPAEDTNQLPLLR